MSTPAASQGEAVAQRIDSLLTSLDLYDMEQKMKSLESMGLKVLQTVKCFSRSAETCNMLFVQFQEC